MVVAVLDERRRLRRAAAQDHTEMLRLRGIMRMQADRIGELQGDIVMEQEQTNALRLQLQVVNDRLTNVVGEVEAPGVGAPGEGVTPSPSHGGESVGSVGN